MQKAYVQLDELLAPQELWDWVQASDDFDCVRDGNSMVVSWAASSAASGATSSADHAPAMLNPPPAPPTLLALEDASRAPTAQSAAAAPGRDEPRQRERGGWRRGTERSQWADWWGQGWGQD